MTPAVKEKIEIQFDGIVIYISGKRLRRVKRVFLAGLIFMITQITHTYYKLSDLQTQLTACKQAQQQQPIQRAQR